MFAELQAKSAVVTGASRGIGFAIADALAYQGCSVVMTSRSSPSAEDAAAKLVRHRSRVIPYKCDVRHEIDVERLFELVRDEFGTLDFLINNAGIFGPAVPIDQVPTDAWRETLDVNLTGTFHCTRLAVPLMKPGSVIVNNISVAAKQAFPKTAAYTASKQGLVGLTNVTREDLREKGIRVVALMPGATHTDIWNQFWPEAPREKMMPPKDVAAAVIHALLMPPGTSVDEIHIMPAQGIL